MGGIVSRPSKNGSKYKLEEDAEPAEPCSWIAPATVDVGSLKADNFRTKTVTGKGKFGCVYLSQNVKTKQYVAVKFIAYQMIFDGKHADRVDQELRVVKELDHPFIIHFFGAYRTPGSVAMVFEYAMGGELYHRMKSAVTMSEDEAKFYVCEIAVALHYLHNTAGIVYRDLKPENVLLDSQGHIKICDFGFAALLDAAHSLTDGCGTVMYLAPEIAAGQKSSKHGLPVDWWSLGCILYEIVTGNAPFGDTDKESKFAILNNINGKALRYPMSMSSELKELLTGLLKKDDHKRWKWDDVEQCAWMSDVEWVSVGRRKIRPPWLPVRTTLPDTSNFLEWNAPPDPHVAPQTKEAASYCVDSIAVPSGPARRSTSMVVRKERTPTHTPPPSQAKGDVRSASNGDSSESTPTAPLANSTSRRGPLDGGGGQKAPTKKADKAMAKGTAAEGSKRGLMSKRDSGHMASKRDVGNPAPAAAPVRR